MYGYVHDLNIWIDVFGLLKIYRGVNENHYGYNDALNGKAKPKGGSATPSEHNQDNTNSKYTSWTTDSDVAKNYALRPKGESVVLELDIDENKLVKIPNTKTVVLKQSGVEVSKSEVLVKGKVKGATVEHVH